MHFELDLAIAYACALGLFCWLAFWFVPLAFGALVQAVAQRVRTRRAPRPRGNLPGDPHPLHEDWWGPAHHSH